MGWFDTNPQAIADALALAPTATPAAGSVYSQLSLLATNQQAVNLQTTLDTLQDTYIELDDAKLDRIIAAIATVQIEVDPAVLRRAIIDAVRQSSTRYVFGPLNTQT